MRQTLRSALRALVVSAGALLVCAAEARGVAQH
jgi:hypothetical protein